MLEKTKEYLKNAGALNTTMAPIIQLLIKAMPDPTIPLRFKQTLAVSELMLFASHLRRNIQHWDSTSVPTNAITFILSTSGSGKDSSVKAIRKCFTEGYKIIDNHRKSVAKQKAITKAFEAGLEMPSEFATYKDFYIKPEELFAAPDSTIKGLTKHFNQLEESGIGAGYVYSGEFSTEMSNGSAGELMKFMSEVYDTGNKEIKLIGAKDEQLKSLKSLPVSALFQGSAAPILYDENIKKLFKTEFNSKLARRSFFCFIKKTITLKTYTGKNAVKDMLQDEIDLENQAIATREQINKAIKDLTSKAIPLVNQPLEISPEVREIFLVYKRYNNEIAKSLETTHPISALVRKHLQWKALKLAGALSIYPDHSQVELIDYIYAINYCELITPDILSFEEELVKEPYQYFADYMKSIAISNKATITLHQLRKLGYIPTTGSSKNRLIELTKLAASYDPQGVYLPTENSITYEHLEPTPISGVSYVPVSGSKQQRAKQCATNFQFQEITFPQIANLLKKDLAYSSFQFKDGIRGKDSIIGGTKWIILDIDNSVITAEDCHYILQDINHHIALTSDSNNDFKFRVILELDSFVDIDNKIWRYFIESIASSLALTTDFLPKSQIFFSYADREVLSVTDKMPIQARDHILIATDKATEKIKPAKAPTKTEAKALIDNPYSTFNFAFECPENGSGTRTLIAAAFKAKELGMDNDAIIELLTKINDYWASPMPTQRFQDTILSVVQRL